MRIYMIFFAILLMFVSDTRAQTIHRIACNGNLTKLDSLLQKTSIDVRDNRGRSLLHWTVACRQKEIFDFLVDKGININAEDNNNETAMHVAVVFENETYFNMLLDLQTNKNWIKQYGASLLEKAILNESLIFVRKLINTGVDINVINDRGSTPLEISMRIGAKEISDWLLSMGADEGKVRVFEFKGKYMEQPEPGLMPKMFAPNFISTEESEFGSVFNSEGNEFYYGVDVDGKPEIRYSRLVNDRWSNPEIILPNERFGYNDPFLSPDEKRLYFISKRTLDGTGDPKDHDIWYIEKEERGWSQPINAGPNINSAGNEYYISFTNDGTMYFSSNVHALEENNSSDYDIYYSKYVDGEFQEAVSLGDSINTSAYEADVFVAPDESYVIFCATRTEGLGRGDLYISFRNSDGTWSKSTNMGEPINTKHHELCPYVTTDGKYFFYTSNQDIYWVNADIIEEIRKRKNR